MRTKALLLLAVVGLAASVAVLLQLTGRGYLVWDGQTSSGGGAHVRTFPVVGGTAEFNGATGYIQSAKQADTGPGIDWTIVLSG